MAILTMAELNKWTDVLNQEFEAFEQDWARYHAELRTIEDKAYEVLAPQCEEQGISTNNARIGGWGLNKSYMLKSWHKIKSHLETFTDEREAQTERMIRALEEIEAIKTDLAEEQAKLREEQKQMRDEQAVLREYFNTLKSQNEALMATRSAPSSTENSTLSEIKSLIKELKDD